MKIVINGFIYNLGYAHAPPKFDKLHLNILNFRVLPPYIYIYIDIHTKTITYNFEMTLPILGCPFRKTNQLRF